MIHDPLMSTVWKTAWLAAIGVAGLNVMCAGEGSCSGVVPIPGQNGSTTANFRVFLAEAFLRDPVTGTEIAEAVRAARARQKLLYNWFIEHDMHVSQATCTDGKEADYLESFRTEMATHRLLLLPRRKRDLLYDEMVHYSHALERVMPQTFDGMCREAPDVAGFLHQRWLLPITFRGVYFGTPGDRSPASVMVPSWQRCYLDLNVAAEHPERFFDCFEHELWHHLMPLDENEEEPVATIWLEGFNECLAELWRQEFDRAADLHISESRRVTYPLQTALASLFLGWQRENTLRFLSGRLSTEEFQSLLNTSADGPNLRSIYLDSQVLSPGRRQRVIRILADWGWRLPGPDSVYIDLLVRSDGRLDTAALKIHLREHRNAVSTFLDAHAAVLLQDVLEKKVRHRLVSTAEERLAPALATNLKRVSNYLSAPSCPIR